MAQQSYQPAYKARTVVGVINMKAPDGSPISKHVDAVEAIRQGIAIPGPVLTFDGVKVGPDLGRYVGEPPAAMLADDRVIVACPCGDPWPGSTQDRKSARAPSTAKERHDGGQRVGPGYMLNKQRLGEWPTEDCKANQERLAFNLENPGALAEQKAIREGRPPNEVARIKAEAVARSKSASAGRNSVAAGDLAAARAALATATTAATVKAKRAVAEAPQPVAS